MTITENTKLSELIQSYPWLKEELPTISSKFKMLQSPMGKIMAKKATIAEMSRRSSIDATVLIQKLEQLIAAHE